jgi:hypothetical protein
VKSLLLPTEYEAGVDRQKGKITDYGMNSPFVHLRCFIQDLSTSRNGKGGSEQIREGAQISGKPPTDDVERFLSMLRFDSREK